MNNLGDGARICIEITSRFQRHASRFSSYPKGYASPLTTLAPATPQSNYSEPLTFVKIDRTYLQNIHDDSGIKLNQALDIHQISATTSGGQIALSAKLGHCHQAGPKPGP